MIVKLATFTKRENSTKVFSGEWLEFDCVLKERCSVINPIFELQTTTNLSAINYARIDAFNRFYFVSVSYERDTVILTMTCDVMATYKSEIGASSEYILRAASDYDGDIIDTLYPTKTECVFDVGSSTACFDDSELTYVVGVINNTATNKVGVTKYYAMTATQLGDLVTFLFGSNPTDYMGNMSTFITGLTAEFQNAVIRSLANPSQFIVESFALPYKPETTSDETLTIGYLPSYCSGSPITTGALQKRLHSTISLTLPSHPMAATRGHYLSSAPYTRYWLDLGVFGIYPIDAAIAIDYPSVDIDVLGDMFGNVQAVISLGGHVIDCLHANVKCNFPIAQVSYDVIGAAQSAISAITNTQTTADEGDSDAITSAVVGGVGKMASGIMSSLKALQPQVSRQGNQGSFVNAFVNFTSRACYFIPVDDDNTHRGRPLCKERTISSLSGYILVADADIATAGTKEETQQIKNHMNNGFYYE